MAQIIAECGLTSPIASAVCNTGMPESTATRDDHIYTGSLPQLCVDFTVIFSLALLIISHVCTHVHVNVAVL